MKTPKRTDYNMEYEVQYFLAFVTKNRNKCITSEMLIFLENEFIRLTKLQDIDLLDFKGGIDYVRMLIKCHPNILMSRFIGGIKSASSQLIRTNFKERLIEVPIFWGRSYCLVSTAPDGKTAQQIVDEYINNEDLKT